MRNGNHDEIHAANGLGDRNSGRAGLGGQVGECLGTSRVCYENLVSQRGKATCQSAANLACPDESDVFFRYEAFPTSLRIDQVNQKVTKPDTYATPFSERDFTPTGLSAVGRFALPSLDPHRWRWELQPVANTHVYYGASVPLYGQSGGAVEVMFPDPFDNTIPIPNPAVLDIL